MEDLDPKDIMSGIVGVTNKMMKNLHIIAEKDCECAEIAKETLVVLGDTKYKKIGT
jgi:hypothetical protein